MPTLIGIILIVIVFSLAKEIPGHAWIGIGIVATVIAVFVAVWFGITYLLKASIGIVTKNKD